MRQLFKLLSLAFLLLFSFPALAQHQEINASDVKSVVNDLAQSVNGMDRNIALSSGSVRVRTDIYQRYDRVVNALNGFIRLHQRSENRYKVNVRESRQALERFATSIDDFLMAINSRDLSKSDYRKLSRAGEEAMQLAITLHAFAERTQPNYPGYPNQPNYPGYPNQPNYPGYPNQPNYPQPNPYPNPNVSPYYPPGVPTQLSFQQIKSSVAMQANDQLRAQLINQHMRVQSLTTQQLIELLAYIRDENIRMSVAYENYPYVSDAQQNWYSIYDAYSYGDVFEQNMIKRYPTYKVRTRVMSDGDYQTLLRTVKNAGARKDKVRVIDRAMPNMNITVEQLIGLLNALDFGDDKVDIAAKCYPRIVDRNNWYKVYEALPFSTNKAELDRRLGLK